MAKKSAKALAYGFKKTSLDSEGAASHIAALEVMVWMWLKAEIECRGKCSLAQTILFQTFHTFSPLHIIYIALGLLLLISVLLSSVTKLCPTLYDPMVSFTPDFPVYHQLLEFTQTHVHWVSDAIQSSYLLLPILFLPSIFPIIRIFPISQFFASGGQTTEPSASASVLPMNIQDWCPLGWTGWISLQSKGLSRVFSSTILQKYQLFGPQLSFWSNSHIYKWLLEKS